MSPKRDTPRSHQLLPTEVDAIVEYKKKHLELGYRRLAWMMVDEDVAYASPASVHRVYVRNGLNTKFTRDGGTKHPTGFEQPESAHEQWHIDIAYINVFSTFMFLITILDGFSRFIVSWRLFRTMRSLDVEIVLQRAFEGFSGVNPRVITDNGSQFLSKDFKSMLKHFGIEHSKSRVNHPQSNGKIERYHRSIKSECIRKQSFLDDEDATHAIGKYVDHYNYERLHGSLNYLTPYDYLTNNIDEKIAERRKKLYKAKMIRKEYWKQKMTDSA